MCKFLSKILVLFLLLTSINFWSQETVYTTTSVPNPKDFGGGWVSDPNNYLSPEDRTKLNTSIDVIENASTAQIAVVIVPSIGNEVPKDFAIDLFELWGIGQAQKDNGLLILTVIDQRRTEFEVGYGLEPILTDALTFRIGTQELVPHFKNGDYGLGLITAVSRIQQILDNPEVVNEIYDDGGGVVYKPNLNPIFPIVGIYLLLFLLAMYFYFSNVLKINKNKEDFYDKFQELYKMKHFIYMILFPLPFIIIRYLFIKSRLSKYRNHQRFSKKNGKEMFKKTDITEDPFLNKGQLVEENIRSIDYDVWATKDEDDILVLKYKRLFTKYTKCPKCSYKTYYTAHSRTVRAATKSSTGLREETYQCKNCSYSKVKQITISKVTSSSSSGSGFGGSSGGGSSFGGGSSGGGGGGVSW